MRAFGIDNIVAPRLFVWVEGCPGTPSGRGRVKHNVATPWLAPAVGRAGNAALQIPANECRGGRAGRPPPRGRFCRGGVFATGFVAECGRPERAPLHFCGFLAGWDCRGGADVAGWVRAVCGGFAGWVRTFRGGGLVGWEKGGNFVGAVRRWAALIGKTVCRIARRRL